jgi:hypothetical protein
MTGHHPTRVEIGGGHEDSLKQFSLGERVNFQGKEDSGASVTGYFICAFETLISALAFAQDIASYLGLASSEPKSETDSFVGEFLNVVIGLTCSTWADHGLRVDFNPPERLQAHAIDKYPTEGHFFQVSIRVEGFYQTTIFLHFLPESKKI